VKAPAGAVKHTRTVLGVDVAACGARGEGTWFAPTLKAITCKACAEKRAARQRSGRAKLEMAARRAHFQGRTAKGLWFG
jgi:pantothenate synthetase